MPIARPPSRPFAWQGWQLALPRRWDPVQLAGTAAAGHALFADALRPRLGLRWQTPRKRLDPDVAVRRTLVAEVGTLAADEAVPCEPDGREPLDPDDDDADPGPWICPMVYVEPEPPGRDVWVGYSALTGRLLTVVYHGRRRDRVLAHVILPTLAEADAERATPWAAFELSVVVPGDFGLIDQRLDAGDLALSFADRRGAAVSVRQIAVAELALRRRPLDGWLADAQQPFARLYRPAGPAVDVDDPMPGRLGRMMRRRRFSLAPWQPAERFTLAVHDGRRDRLVILSGPDADLLAAVAATVGTTG